MAPEKILSVTVFAVYNAILLFILINPLQYKDYGIIVMFGGIAQQGKVDEITWFKTSINLIPFKTIFYYLTVGDGIDHSIVVSNLLGKLLLYIP